MERRYLKNTENNRVFPWTKALSKKVGMVDCDEHGNIKVENISIEEGELLRKLQDKAKEANELRKENAILKAELKKYISMHGEFENQLPAKTLDDKIKEAEESGNLVTNDDENVEELNYESMTNKELKDIIKNEGLEMPEKTNKASLIETIVKGDVGE
jgi:vacuolar-type H+-ATPase subunit I/STV1